jgi:hypothetical protein
MPAITVRIPQLPEVTKPTLQIIANVIFLVPDELTGINDAWVLCFNKLVEKKYNIRGFRDLDAFISWCTDSPIPPKHSKDVYRLYCQAVLSNVEGAKGLVDTCFKYSKRAQFTSASSMKKCI